MEAVKVFIDSLWLSMTQYEYKTFHISSVSQLYHFNTFVFYVKHIFELCWEILQGIYPKESDTQPPWYKTRPQDDINKSLHDVQVKCHKPSNN